jgi:hypothetical protein
MSEPTITPAETPDPSVADLTAYRAGKAAPVVEPPAETPAAEAPAEAEAEAPAEVPEAAEPDPASDAGKALAKKRNSLQARIDELTAREKAAERRAAALEAELQAARGQAPAPQPAPVADRASEYKRIMALPDAPRVDQFDSYEEYTFAAGVFVDEVRTAERTARQQQHAEASAVLTARDRVEAAIKAAHPDFDEVIDSFAGAGHVYAPAVVEFILHHPAGHEAAYLLAKDPALNARISALRHPAAIVFELGKVLAGQAAPVAEPVKPITRAPAPVTTVGSGGSASSATPDPASMNSVAEWRKIRGKF